MQKESKPHNDTSISLHPLSFEQAIQTLVNPKRKDSQAVPSRKTKSRAPASGKSKKRT